VKLRIGLCIVKITVKAELAVSSEQIHAISQQDPIVKANPKGRVGQHKLHIKLFSFFDATRMIDVC
jgi:hypothetical protein